MGGGMGVAKKLTSMFEHGTKEAIIYPSFYSQVRK